MHTPLFRIGDMHTDQPSQKEPCDKECREHGNKDTDEQRLRKADN